MKNDSNEQKEGRRRYNAPIRREQSELTRQRILEASRQLFAERGYVSTTVEAIASHARVAVPTLYVTFGSKRQILTALVIQLKTVHDVPARAQALIADPDPHRQLLASAQLTHEFAAAAWDVIEVLRAASKSDPELATLWDQVEGARLRDQQEIVRKLAENGTLKPGLDTKRAADIFWTLTSHDLYQLLVIERGWSGADYEQWIATTLSDLLLP